MGALTLVDFENNDSLLWYSHIIQADSRSGCCNTVRRSGDWVNWRLLPVCREQLLLSSNRLLPCRNVGLVLQVN